MLPRMICSKSMRIWRNYIQSPRQFHNIVAKALYPVKRARPDSTVDMPLILGADTIGVLYWFVDAIAIDWLTKTYKIDVEAKIKKPIRSLWTSYIYSKLIRLLSMVVAFIVAVDGTVFAINGMDINSTAVSGTLRVYCS